MKLSQVLFGASRMPLTPKRGNKDFYKGEAEARAALEPPDLTLAQAPVNRMHQAEVTGQVRQENMSWVARPSFG